MEAPDHVQTRFRPRCAGCVRSRPLWAHHSAAAEYDASKTPGPHRRSYEGRVEQPSRLLPPGREERRRRHHRLYLEMASPNGMLRQGWRPTTIKPGDMVTVEAYAAKDTPR